MAKKDKKSNNISLRNLLIIVFTILVVGFLIYYIDIQNIKKAVQAVGIFGVLTIFFSYSIVMLARALRWKLLLDSANETLPTSYLLKVALVAWGQNAFLPARLGEVSRLYYLKRDYNVSVGKNTAAILSEKILDILSLGLILGISALIASQYANVNQKIDTILLVIAVLSFIGIIALAIFSLYGDRFTPLFKKSPKLQNLYRHFQGNFAKGMKELTTSPKTLVLSAILSIFQWIFEAMTISIVAFFIGIDLHFSVVLLASMFGYASYVFPLLPGNVGSFEAIVAFFLVNFGISNKIALAIPLITHVIVVLYLLLTGGASFITLGAIEPNDTLQENATNSI